MKEYNDLIYDRDIERKLTVKLMVIILKCFIRMDLI
jgi:hypothetical protein